ncbi:hypothetical protein pb186bvf_010843 [Paramecium bursaria]
MIIPLPDQIRAFQNSIGPYGDELENGDLLVQLQSMHSEMIKNDDFIERFDRMMDKQQRKEAYQDDDYEEELQQKNWLLDQANKQITILQNQVQQLNYELERTKQFYGKNITMKGNEITLVDDLNIQMQYQAEIHQRLSKQMINSNQEVEQLKQDYQDALLKIEKLNEQIQDQMGDIQSLRETIQQKKDEIDIISQDFSEKLNNKDMIIQELEDYNKKLLDKLRELGYDCNSGKSYELASNQRKQGSDVSLGSKKSVPDRQQMIKNLKRMTSITAGAMSIRQDFHTLKILGSMDNVKSVKKIDQFQS